MLMDFNEDVKNEKSVTAPDWTGESTDNLNRLLEENKDNTETKKRGKKFLKE